MLAMGSSLRFSFVFASFFLACTVRAQSDFFEKNPAAFIDHQDDHLDSVSEIALSKYDSALSVKSQFSKEEMGDEGDEGDKGDESLTTNHDKEDLGASNADTVGTERTLHQVSAIPAKPTGPVCMGAKRVWNAFKGSNAGRRRLLSMAEDPHEQRTSTLTLHPAENHTRMSYRRQLTAIAQRQDLKDKVTPLRRAYCSGKMAQPPALIKDWSAGQRALRLCLRGGHQGCPPSLREAATQGAAALPSMKLLNLKPKCFSVLGPSGQCATLDGNPETSIGGRYLTAIRPTQDWKWKQWSSCALVGRSPVIKIHENGPAIDRHDAVWRFNLQATKGYSNFVGRKTSLRLVNNADSSRAANGLKGKSEQEMFTVGREDWAFWQYNSIPQIAKIKQRLKAKTRLLSPYFLRWQMNLYFALKRDLEALGLGPFHCPTSVSSGMHAVFMALGMCREVSLFGYSYYDEMLTTRAGHNNGPQNFFSGHSWTLDLAMVRTLHIAGHLTVCTGDDPSIPLATLRNKGGRDY